MNRKPYVLVVLVFALITLLELGVGAQFRFTRGGGFELGQVWRVQENDWEGTWTRRGTSDIFDAEWRNSQTGQTVRDVLRVESILGNQIILYREGTRGRYRGIISQDGRSIRNGQADWDSNSHWTAEIESDYKFWGRQDYRNQDYRNQDYRDRYQRERDSLNSFNSGRIWAVREGEWDATWTRRGTSNTFDGYWRHRRENREVRDVLVLESVRGDEVTLLREGTGSRYHGRLSSDRRSIRSSGQDRPAGDAWSAEIQFNEQYTDEPDRPARYTQIINLGEVWQVREGEWKGTWTRRGRSNTFDAVWRHVREGREIRDVIELESFDGQVVVLYRQGTRGRYQGVVSRNQRSVKQGTMDWDQSGLTWSAKIKK